MTATGGFVLTPDWDDRLPWPRTVGTITATEVLRGADDTELAVVLATACSEPARGDVQGLWRARSQHGVAPVLLAVAYPTDMVCLMGLGEDAVPVFDVPRRIAERLIADTLTMNSPSGLHTEVRRRLTALAQGVASGLRNEGLLASHVLDQQSHTRGWGALCTRSGVLLGLRREVLLKGLGFAVETVPQGVVLRDVAGDGTRRAAVVLLTDGESFEHPLVRLQNTNAVQHGIAFARRESLPWLVVLGGPVIRLYPVNPDTGVGRKGQTQTYVELDLSILAEAEAGYLSLIFSASSLRPGGDLERLLDESSRFATELSRRLRRNIFADVVPALAIAVANKRGVAGLAAADQKDALDEAYHQTMIILFRLLFVAYAEDRGLLPYATSARYRRNALKTLAQDLLEPGQVFDEHSTTLWDDLTQVWKVIDTGDLGSWGIPAYNGGLFTRDAAKNPSGAATYGLDLTNDAVGPALTGLLIDMDADGTPGSVDFRSLSVREFGTIYEGLLEAGLGIADRDLALNTKDKYVPAGPTDSVKVKSGEVYFHTLGGSRKATGSYFTKPFAVKHLLDTALEPALDAHLDGVRELMQAGATKGAAVALFDFRVADLAMGSAHFLVAAVDRIEARFSAFVAENPLPEVAVQLHSLRMVAVTQLGVDPRESGIDDGMLLRRQIARRCIYGADINEIAVELARLAMWIHTFVPGLPLSFLNHGLVWGNSLTGVGTLAEIGEALADAEHRELKKKTPAAAQMTSYDAALDEFLDRAAVDLAALGSLSDASVGDVATATNLQAALTKSLEPLAALCDLITAERVTRAMKPGEPGKVQIKDAQGIFLAMDSAGLERAVLTHPRLVLAREIARTVRSAHMPVTFPEVFRRDRPGFDCILGNPPWDKVLYEAQQFWVTRDPGLNALSTEKRDDRIEVLRVQRPEDAEEERRERTARERMQALAKNGYSLLGGGHFDFAKMFAERFLCLTRSGGSVGVVLPEASLLVRGWGKLRRALLSGHTITAAECRNTGGWLFESVHMSTAVVMFTRVAGPPGITILPGLVSEPAFDARWESPIPLTVDEAGELSDTFVLPWFKTPADSAVFTLLLAGHRLGSEQGWITGVNDARWDFRGSAPNHRFAHPAPGQAGDWPVLQARHVDAYLITDDAFTQAVDPSDLVTLRPGVEVVAGEVRLAAEHPAITFRNPSRNDDSRTLIAAALPAAGFLPNKGYAHGVKHPAGTDPVRILALLGYMNSVVADWWCRRFADRHISAGIINGLVLPSWTPTQIERAAGCARDLLRANGQHTMVGGVDLDGVLPQRTVSADPRAELDALAAVGFALSEDNMRVVFSDFADTPTAVPSSRRLAVLALLRAGGLA